MQRKNLNYQKYLKYKNKYLNLRNQIGGDDEEVKKLVIDTNNLIEKQQFKEAVEYLYNHPVISERVLALRQIRSDNSKEVLEKIDLFIQRKKAIHKEGNEEGNKEGNKEVNEKVNELVIETNNLIEKKQFEEALVYLFNHPDIRERTLALRQIRRDKTKEVLENIDLLIQRRKAIYT